MLNSRPIWPHIGWGCPVCHRVGAVTLTVGIQHPRPHLESALTLSTGEKPWLLQLIKLSTSAGAAMCGAASLQTHNSRAENASVAAVTTVTPRAPRPEHFFHFATAGGGMEAAFKPWRFERAGDAPTSICTTRATLAPRTWRR